MFIKLRDELLFKLINIFKEKKNITTAQKHLRFHLFTFKEIFTLPVVVDEIFKSFYLLII